MKKTQIKILNKKFILSFEEIQQDRNLFCNFSMRHLANTTKTFSKKPSSHSLLTMHASSITSFFTKTDDTKTKTSKTHPIFDQPNTRIIAFDLETTGRSATRCEIVEICACMVSPKSFKPINWFERLVKPIGKIDVSASKVHGLWPKDVKFAPQWNVVGKQFVDWCLTEFKGKRVENIVFVTYNGQRFDLPILSRLLGNAGISFGEHVMLYSADIFIAAKAAFPRPGSRDVSPPPDGLHSHKQTDVHNFLFGSHIQGAHEAKADVEALVKIGANQAIQRNIVIKNLF